MQRGHLKYHWIWIDSRTNNEGTYEDARDQPEEEIPVEPVDDSLPLRHSNRVRMPHEFYGFHITTYGDTFISDSTLVNLDETANYKEVMAGPKAAKW